MRVRGCDSLYWSGNSTLSVEVERMTDANSNDGPDAETGKLDPRPVTLSHITDELRAEGPDVLQSVVRRYGPLATRLAALGIALERRLTQPRLKNYPPAIFLAYKWESDVHQARVRDIAEHLRGRGYRVYLDQDHLEREASDYTEVPQYIANMVGSDVFLILASKRYVDMVTARTGQTTWVHDEYSTAVTLHNRGRLRLHAICLDPSVSLEGNLSGISVTTLGEGPDALADLNGAFPVYAGPVLDAAGDERLRAFAQVFDRVSDGESLKTLLLEAHAELSHLYDYQYRLCRFYFLIGEVQKAHALALHLIDDCDFDEHSIYFAQVLDAAGDLGATFKFLYRQRRRGRLRGSMHYHYFMAATLLEQGSVSAAHNHFAWLLGSPQLAQQPAELQSLVAARHQKLSEIVASIGATTLYRCNECPAAYPCSDNMDRICGDCGTLYDRSHALCPVCSNDGRIPLELLGLPGCSLMCPVCGEGGLVAYP